MTIEKRVNDRLINRGHIFLRANFRQAKRIIPVSSLYELERMQVRK